MNFTNRNELASIPALAQRSASELIAAIFELATYCEAQAQRIGGLEASLATLEANTFHEGAYAGERLTALEKLAFPAGIDLNRLAALETRVTDLGSEVSALTVELDGKAAGEIDYAKLAKAIDLSDLAGELDLSDLANEMNVSDIADHLDLDDIADKLDIADKVSDVINNGSFSFSG